MLLFVPAVTIEGVTPRALRHELAHGGSRQHGAPVSTDSPRGGGVRIALGVMERPQLRLGKRVRLAVAHSPRQMLFVLQAEKE